jgi:hypothetical protein
MRGFSDEGGASQAPAFLTPMSQSEGRKQSWPYKKGGEFLKRSTVLTMETSQQCVLELALRFFPIESDSRLTERHLQHFDWLMSKSLSEWQYLGFVDQRPRRGAFVPPNPSDHYYMYVFFFFFFFFYFFFFFCSFFFCHLWFKIFCLPFFYFFFVIGWILASPDIEIISTCRRHDFFGSASQALTSSFQKTLFGPTKSWSSHQ